jgi:5-methylcytosine-specific restriction endonuclease McrA
MDSRMTYEEFLAFVNKTMSLSEIYQPVILLTLLNSGAISTKEQLAKALMTADVNNMTTWQKILMRYPKQVLTDHKVLKYDSKTKTFNLLVESLTPKQVSELSANLEKKISSYNKSKVVKQASAKYKKLAAARGCCEACGAPGNKFQLHVDHIVPQSKANKDKKVKLNNGELINVHDEGNLQVLCVTCNTGKRDADDFDFRPSPERLIEVIAGVKEIALENGYPWPLINPEDK